MALLPFVKIMLLDYSHIRSSQFTKEEHERFRIARKAESRLSGTLANPVGNKIVEGLYELLSPPFNIHANNITEWCWTYGTPALKTMLIDALSNAYTNKTILNLVKEHAHPSLILPKDHTLPDLQKVKLNDKLNTVLVCFMGNAHKLNVPAQVFYFIAAKFLIVFTISGIFGNNIIRRVLEIFLPVLVGSQIIYPRSYAPSNIYLF